MSSYRLGRRFEYRVKNLYQKSGWLVVRAARSMPIDLVCMKDGITHLVECKIKRGKESLSPKGREVLLSLAKQAGGKAIFARREGHRKLRLMVLEQGSEEEFKL